MQQSHCALSCLYMYLFKGGTGACVLIVTKDRPRPRTDACMVQCKEETDNAHPSFDPGLNFRQLFDCRIEKNRDARLIMMSCRQLHEPASTGKQGAPL